MADLSTASFQGVVGSYKVPPEPPFIIHYLIYHLFQKWLIQDKKFLCNEEDYAQKPCGVKGLRNFVLGSLW